VPDPILSVWEWADLHRVLSSKDSAEPGPHRTSRIPYAREPMGLLSPHDRTQVVVLMWGAQTAKTSIILNAIGCWSTVSPGPILAIMPTLQMAERWSKQRLAPMIEASPSLRNLFTDPKSRSGDNTILEKAIPGGMLYAGGANSPAALRSMPIRYLCMDEIDAFPEDVGGAANEEQGEGDPIDLATKRTAGYKSNKKIVLTSTPTIRGRSRIEKAYLASDQRRYHVPCPRCGEFQILAWPQVKWPEGQPELAYYECAACHGRIDNHEKEQMLPCGEWRAANPSSHVAGFHLSALYAPHGFDDWGTIAAEFVEVKDDPPRLKTWVNTRLAETWDEREGKDEVPPQTLAVRGGDWGERIPAGVRVITAGIDTQDDRFEMEIVGWGDGFESWSLDYLVIPASVTDGSDWKDLDLNRGRTYVREDGVTLRVALSCIDMGGHRTDDVYAYTRARSARDVIAIKGVGGYRPVVERTARKNERKHGAHYRIIGVDAAKNDIYARLKVQTPGPGHCHFPANRDAKYFAGLTSEHRDRRKVHGRTVVAWTQHRDYNEPLDTRVYAYAALLILQIEGRLTRALTALTRPEPKARASDTTGTVPAPPDNQPQGAPRPLPRPSPANWVMGRGPKRGRWL
jgi:phage terminase large subunit GpA-like protein